MKRWTARWTMAATAAALLTLPVTSAAQSTSPQPPASTQQPTGTTSAQQPNAAAQEHLQKARAALDEVKTTNLSAAARTHVNELKKRMTALERAAGVNSQASATGQAQQNPRATQSRGNANWGTEVAAMDKALTTLLGQAGEGSANPTTTGTSGTAASKQTAAIKLDDETRTKLTEVRTHITAFATAMAGGTPSSSTPDTTSATGTSTSAAAGTSGTSTSGTTGTTGTSGSSAAGTTGSTTPQTQPPDPQQTQPAAAQVDQEAARRHLTEARNSLSAMTQLPAASQLQGEARTQISQLIGNFNELITTQAEWRASYAKVEANLTALIGPDPEATQPTGTTTGTTGTTGITGTAGTSGAGMADLDPAVREKLVELRRHLNQFEKAAGGSAAGGTSAPSTPAAAGTAASGTTGTTSGTAATPPTGTSGTTGTATTGQQTATAGQQSTAAPANQAEIAKHLAAIDSILQTTDESGGLTLTKAQVEQLRTHWTALRQILNERR